MTKKKSILWISCLLVLSLALMLVACGDSPADTPDAPAEEEEVDSAEEVEETEENGDVTAVDGELYETEKFSMIIADGWDAFDVTGGLQALKDGYMLEVWVRGSGLEDADALKAIENMAADWDGTDAEVVEFLGMDFYSTEYDFMGMEQTKYSAVRDGERIEITFSHDDYSEDAVMWGMVESITFN